MRNIVLVGFMGSGKTSVGALVAESLGWQLLELDRLIEQTLGKSIPRTFAEDGEALFRETEAGVIGRLVRRQPSRVLVATGGGAPVNPANAGRLRSLGLVVWLRGRPDTILGRLGRSAGRPVLETAVRQGADLRSAIERLLGSREEAYRACADVTVDTDGLSVEEVARDVVQRACALGIPERASAGRVPVRLGRRSYDVLVGEGLLASIGSLLRGVSLRCNREQGAPFGDRLLIVSSEPVWRNVEAQVGASFEAAGFRCELALVPDGERAKTLDAYGDLAGRALQAGLDRSSPVVAVGGGTVGDLAGFLAATLLRGVPFVQAPTTLLAQVDSSIGGKVAVNHPLGKNLIGSFYQPVCVVSDVSVLRSLPEAEIASGAAEAVKCGVIADPALFGYLERNAAEVVAGDPPALRRVVLGSARVKARIVGQDETERHRDGARQLLNLGHTFGHAAETLLAERGLRHGHAVSMGVAAACMLSIRLGLMQGVEAERVDAVLASLGLPTRLQPGLDEAGLERLHGLMARDKKVRKGSLNLVIPTSIGGAEVRDDIDPRLVREVARDVFARRTSARG